MIIQETPGKLESHCLERQGYIENLHDHKKQHIERNPSDLGRNLEGVVKGWKDCSFWYRVGALPNRSETTGRTLTQFQLLFWYGAARHCSQKYKKSGVKIFHPVPVTPNCPYFAIFCESLAWSRLLATSQRQMAGGSSD